MWIVKLALRRPYTFIVMALLILILGVVTIQKTPTDVFPNIDIPVVTMIWTYGGISPSDMEKRITTLTERAATTTVGDIEHIESQSMPGITVIRFYFQPGAKVEAGVAQLTSISQTLIRAMPTGTTPPLIIRYSASSVPILQLGLSSKTLSETQLYDFGTNVIRTQLATVQGASVPLPYGGKSRQIMVDLDLQALQAKGLNPLDVSTAINAQNLILPTGTIKMGPREYNVFMNSSPGVASDIGNLPIKQVNGATVYVRDVANVHDGFAVQSNVVSMNGRRSALITVLKSGDASTLDVVQRVKTALPKIQQTLPPELKIEPLFDQSLFVRSAVNGVVREAVIAACLTAAMILLFLGSWRSTLIVAVSIPLSILTSIIALGYLGQTMNVMTLGGLALAVGILVDDATVTIENIHRNMHEGKNLRTAIYDGAAQIATPTLVATLSICIVFVSVVFLTGPAKFLFTPMALAVVFAMLASYVLSRTLVPIMTLLMLRKEAHLYQSASEPSSGDVFWKVSHAFNERFERLRDNYCAALTGMLYSRRRTTLYFISFFVASIGLVFFIGRDFFPSVDAGQIRLHVRVPAGTRLEETAHVFNRVEGVIKQTIPAKDLSMTLQNVGLSANGVNLAFSDSSTIGPSDGEILVSLKEGHGSTADYVDELRAKLNKQFPNCTFFFQPADIVSQILNFGLPAPIDVQVVGRSPANFAIANKMAEEIRKIPGAADVHVHQVLDVPSINVNVNRDRAIGLGLTQRDVANSMLISLSSSGQSAPNYWLDPKNGVNYSVAVQTPQRDLSNLSALGDTPVNASGGQSEILDNVATMSRGLSPQVINHYNVQPVYDVYVNVSGRDLGGVSDEVAKIVAKYQKGLPKGTTTIIRGQAQSMNDSFVGLGVGILFAILLVYLLMVVNFQTWIDPFIIIMALPGAISGILWMLFLTSTSFSVPSLMGTIMCIGVATANSILVVTFANERRQHGDSAIEAAFQAGRTRLRPVLMTALAMIIGMLPMALGLGEGGEQNAPLGRAVIGGLLVATATTLFFVPVVYSILRRKQPVPDMEDDFDEDTQPLSLPADTSPAH
ncbi:RND transporter [Capsulimonas corticalis]|uniref:RND transporter n=1 Tax=Capsulimonas corticalis TaxID=2219043 RepID=A0A402CRU4_9BACT|nr:efflux RND transporter permease subunit [Capsulimonas corticalis]BDI28218.1 RND transporter [Capsulimonas corticalis]